ncbi:MAG: ATP synthase F1 subunit epsilon, partial [Bryobacteraceae bacterium]|nr:ATP synthase F1 subunit epsilon [Bryobacteraceae bacterium]
MAATFELEIATPERLLVREQVTEAQIPAANGAIGVLAGHAPLLSELGIGELSYTVNNERHSIAVSGGVLEVLPEQVRVLTMSAERASEIDTARAREAMKRAEERLASPKESLDVARA